MTEEQRKADVDAKAKHFLKEVKSKIRKHRATTELSQEAMSILLGMKQSGFAKIETGEGDITLSRLVQIAAVFKKDVKDLLPQNDKGGGNNYMKENKFALGVNHGSINQYEHTTDTPNDDIATLSNTIHALQERLIAVEKQVADLQKPSTAF